MRDDGPDDLPMIADDWDGGWDGEHLGEATAHAWLDGALPPAEAARAESHVAACADCAALVAEARGLIAGASRVLGALDAVPAGVLPASTPAPASAVARAPRPWWTRVPARAAAAALLLAGGSAVVLRTGGVPEVPREEAAAAAPAAPSPALATDAAVEMAQAPTTDTDSASTPTRAGMRKVTPPAAPAPPVLAERAIAAEPDPAPMAGGLAAAKMRRAPAPITLAAPASAPAPAPPAPAAPERTSGTVAGRVLTEDGRPVAAAQVQLVGGSAGAVTDDSGAFVLRDVRPGPATLQARRVGYQSKVASVVVAGADTASTTVVLHQLVNELSAVAVTGAASAEARAESRDRLAREQSTRTLERRDAAARVAGAPRTALGCYLVTALPGAAPGLRPIWIALDDTPATPAHDAGRPSYVARVVPGGTAVWSPLGGDSLRIGWTDTAGDVVLRLAPAGADRGFAGTIGARPVTARRAACAAMPAR
jgi:hypothetical protein